MKIGSLFAGIGGFDLAAQWMGWETVWYSEIDPYACRVMEQHFPNARNVGDVKTWKPRRSDRVSLITAGFPCQDISSAHTATPKKGLGGENSGLWFEAARVVRLLRPSYVVVENVDHLRRFGLGQVLGDLAKAGYDAWWWSLPAAALGAPHKRARVWVVAYTNSDRQPTFAEYEEASFLPEPSELDWHWRQSTPWHLGVVDGVPSRMDRLRCLGNAIVPQVAYWIFQQIEQVEKMR